MKRTSLTFLAICLAFGSCLLGQKPKENNPVPKLVVGIIVDQMRNDFIYRYWDRFSAGGFKRLAEGGFYFKNAHYNYIPTYTGPGHCSVYTGTTPRVHGVIGNDWYLKQSGTTTYCVYDHEVQTVGADGDNGKMSPKNQLSPTIGDELKISTNLKGKVFGVALKDRSAVFPAGHAADGAFWFDDVSGNFISSTWYMKELPAWLKEFNAKKLPTQYLEKGWSTLYPIATYTNSLNDDNPYEGTKLKDKAVFPYDLRRFVESSEFGTIKSTPYGNSITKDLAIECLKNENLGKDDIADLLSVSFSSPDIISHAYGPRAVEVEDVYLRLDKDIEELLNALDKEVGKDNYVVFLTADHGGADVANHLRNMKIPAGYLGERTLAKNIKQFLISNYGDSLLLASVFNDQVFLNEKLLAEKKLNRLEVEERLCGFLRNTEGIAEAYPSSMMRYTSFENNDVRTLLQNGYNHRLSGNVCYVYKPGWMDHGPKGTTHGSGYNYDTHVPVLFYGKGIKKGETYSYVTITQIAPSVCELLRVNQPGGTFSEPLNNYFR